MDPSNPHFALKTKLETTELSSIWVTAGTLVLKTLAQFVL